MPARKHIEWQLDYSGSLPSPCWTVISHALTARGYVAYRHNGKSVQLHRFAYLSLLGKIPEGMMVRHACDRRNCINPLHLAVGTHADNMDDMVVRGRSLHGERNRAARTNEKGVLDIYARLEAGQSRTEIARDLGYSVVNISRIASGRIWTRLGLQQLPTPIRYVVKLTSEKALQIRVRYAAGEPQREIAKALGVSRRTVSDVVTGRTWAAAPATSAPAPAVEQPAA